MPPVPSLTQNNVGQPGGLAPYQTSSHPNHPNGEPSSSSAFSYPRRSSSPNSQQQQQQQQQGQQDQADKGPDYVYFERKPAQLGESTTGKAMAAKMKLELYYKEAVEGVVGRKERSVFTSCSGNSSLRDRELF